MPLLSASSTIRSPILSLTDPPALKYSHFPTKRYIVYGYDFGNDWNAVRLTQVTFEPRFLGNLVEPNHWRIANHLEDVREHGFMKARLPIATTKVITTCMLEEEKKKKATLTEEVRDGADSRSFHPSEGSKYI